MGMVKKSSQHSHVEMYQLKKAWFEHGFFFCVVVLYVKVVLIMRAFVAAVLFDRTVPTLIATVFFILILFDRCLLLNLRLSCIGSFFSFHTLPS